MSLVSPIYVYSRARSLGYTLEFLALKSLGLLMPTDGAKRKKTAKAPDPALLRVIRADLLKLLREDAQRIEQNIYPLSVLMPESPISHFGRYPRLVLDAFSIHSRKVRGKTVDFDADARELLEGLPRYYRRNFHFQTNGYLSEESAEVYDHQVELLFKGAADAMRRLILKPLREHFSDNPDGRGLRFLEIGAGTGRSTRFVRQAFPRAEIVAVDLSQPYLDVAQRRLAGFSGIEFVQGDGAHLPFDKKKERFDAAYSVFLFHELPSVERKKVLAESVRFLKPGGFLGMVDSIQTGDRPRLDEALRDFPAEYHEPFYRDYIAKPMEDVLKEVTHAKKVSSAIGFTSKVCSLTMAKAAVGKSARSSRASRRPRSAS